MKSTTMRGVAGLFIVALLAAQPLPGRAQEGAQAARRFLVCNTSGVATKEEAKPYIEGFGSYLAQKLGWKEGSYEVRFEGSRAGGLAALAEWKPAFAALSLGIFLEARQARNLKPLVLAKVDGKTTNTYRLLVKKGAYKDLAALAGKKVTGNTLDDPAFLSRVVFAGSLDVTRHFGKLKQTDRPLRAIRKVTRGKADAVLVDETQYQSLKQLPLFAKLEVIFTSKPIPNLGLAYVDGRASAAEIKQFADALTGMCDDAKGKKLCETFNIDAFVPVPDGTLDPIIGLYR